MDIWSPHETAARAQDFGTYDLIPLFEAKSNSRIICSKVSFHLINSYFTVVFSFVNGEKFVLLGYIWFPIKNREIISCQQRFWKNLFHLSSHTEEQISLSENRLVYFIPETNR